MRQFYTIAFNAFMELIRQPIFLLLTTISACFEIALAVPYYFAFGDEPKLVKNSVLAVMLLSGLFGAVLSASSSLAREIRSGTALAVLSKPVGRTQFLLAKFAGVAAALTLMTFINTIAALLASRMSFDAYGDTDKLALGIFVIAVLLAYLFGGFSNYFLRRPFVSDTVLAMVVLIPLAAFVIIQYTHQQESLYTVAQVDWRMVPAAVLILFALFILTALAIACSTRFDTIPTLVICSTVFLLGLMSDYLFGRHTQTSWPASVLYSIVPNWQLFWLADALETDKQIFVWGYVAKGLAYMIGYAGAALAIATALFEERELS